MALRAGSRSSLMPHPLILYRNIHDGGFVSSPSGCVLKWKIRVFSIRG